MGSKQDTRYGQAAILTMIAVAVVAGLGATLGTMAIFLSAITLPVPLVLLWLAADVRSAGDRAEHPVAVRPRDAAPSTPSAIQGAAWQRSG